jgi:MYXO-CTERM domain-containing protein
MPKSIIAFMGTCFFWVASASAAPPQDPDPFNDMIQYDTGTAMPIAENESPNGNSVQLASQITDGDLHPSLTAIFRLYRGGMLVLSQEASCDPMGSETCLAGMVSPSLPQEIYVWSVQVRDPQGELSNEVYFGDPGVDDFTIITGVPPRSPGVTCALNLDCISGFCTDGLCCNSLCSGVCESCDLVTAPGFCVPFDPGTDPEDECLGDEPACASTCSGASSCSPFPGPATFCGAGDSCLGSTLVSNRCDGTGQCASGFGLCPGNLICNGDGQSCLAACVANLDCQAGHYCEVLSQACLPLLDQGQACTAANQCKNGICVDGVCCDGTCDGTCESCNQPTSAGVCTPLPNDAMPDPECGGESGCEGACNGMGTCVYPQGQSCSEDACDGQALSIISGSCDNLGFCQVDISSCSPYRCDSGASPSQCLAMCTGDSDCAPGKTCTGMACQGGAPNGTACGTFDECESGFCVDGFCCGTSCGGTCEQCNASGSEGTCTPYAASTDPESECGGDAPDSCDGQCSGMASCSGGATTGCAPAQCAPDGASVLLPICSVDGDCDAQASACGFFKCTATGNGGSPGCMTTCTDDGDCQDGAFCDGMVCAAQASEGTNCSENSECLNGNCVDGVCCDGSCSNLCEACDLPGRMGTCTFIDPGLDPEDECPGDGFCGGTCDGSGQCDAPASGTPCGTASCVGDQLSVLQCSDAFTCLAEILTCASGQCLVGSDGGVDACGDCDGGPCDVGPGDGGIVGVAPAITRDANPQATVGLAYAYNPSSTVQAAGTAPIIFTNCPGENFPDEFVVNPNSGRVFYQPTQAQLEAGSVQVCIQAANPYGEDKYSFSIAVLALDPNLSPRAQIDPPQVQGPAPLQVDFDGSGSTPIAGSSLLSFVWTPAPGASPLLGSRVSYTYPFAVGVQSCLEVTDAQGPRDETCIPVRAASANGDIPPIPRIVLTPDDADPGAFSLACDCDGGSSPIEAYLWEFGDGDVSDEATTSHTFAAGTYTLRLTVTNGDHLSGISEVSLSIPDTTTGNRPPECAASAGPLAGPVPLNVNFVSTFVDPEGADVDIRWIFPDGIIDGESRVERTFLEPGEHVVEFHAEEAGASGLACTRKLNVVALGPEGQRPPRILSVPNKKATCGKAYHFDEDDRATATGDGPLTWGAGQQQGNKIFGAPAGFVIDPDSGAVRWTPKKGRAEDAYLVITVENEVGVDFIEALIEVSCSDTDDGGDEREGCACGSAGASGPSAFGLSLLGFVFLWTFRKRRTRHS